MIPKLIMKKQQSMFDEVVVKRSASKRLHWVVKNTTFQIHYMLENMPLGVSFKNARVSCRLLYDLKSRKEVDFISSKPLEYVILPSDNGQACIIEFRVKVLTTQLEGSHFIISTAVDHGKFHLEVESESIKAVSKPAQIRRKINEKEGKSSKKNTGRKRKRESELMDIIADMQKVQDEHTEMLHKMQAIISGSQVYSYYPYSYAVDPFAQAQTISTPPLMSNIKEAPLAHSYLNSYPSQYSQIKQEPSQYAPIKKEPKDPQEELQSKMKDVVSLYAQLNPCDREQKIREVMSCIEKESPSEAVDFRSALGATGFDSLPFDYSHEYDINTISDSLMQDNLTELSNFCLDYIQNDGQSTLEY